MNWDELHPLARGPFMRLADELARYSSNGGPCLFKPFEGYRTPARQLEVYKAGKSKAAPFQSAHQFGLAVDFVPFIGGRWSWNVDAKCWDYLRATATRHGLRNFIVWDRPHVEHPIFGDIAFLLKPRMLDLTGHS